MNAKRISLALATLALLSTGSAFAQSVDVNAGPVGVSAGASDSGVGVGANVAGVGANVGVGTGNLLSAPLSFGTNLVDRVFNPPNGWFNLNFMGMGINLGGKKTVQTSGIPAAYMLNGCSTLGATELRTTDYARIIPGNVSLGTARPIQATVEGPKPMFHLDLFNKRMIEVGPDIDPSLDMRID